MNDLSLEIIILKPIQKKFDGFLSIIIFFSVLATLSKFDPALRYLN